MELSEDVKKEFERLNNLIKYLEGFIKFCNECGNPKDDCCCESTTTAFGNS